MLNPRIDQRRDNRKSERGKQTRKQIKAFSRRFTHRLNGIYKEENADVTLRNEKHDTQNPTTNKSQEKQKYLYMIVTHFCYFFGARIVEKQKYILLLLCIYV